MKKIYFVNCLSFFLIGGTLFAQSIDTVSAKKLIEKGTKGDIILGNDYKQKQLNASPQLLQSADSFLKKETVAAPNKKNCGKKKCFKVH